MSNDDLPRSHAEETDATKLGDADVGARDGYPPERPLAVDDPSIRADGSIAPDDVDTRDEREEPEPGEPRGDGGEHGGRSSDIAASG